MAPSGIQLNWWRKRLFLYLLMSAQLIQFLFMYYINIVDYNVIQVYA